MNHPAHNPHRKNRTQNAPFYPSSFTGKEKDEETGYGYFGARYLDYDLTGMWLSVDPLADKYPGISPYAYCAWNPVKLVDPDGNDPIYGKILGAVEKIGDDGKNIGNVYYVTGWARHKVLWASFWGRDYTGSLAPSENVFHVPTGNVARSVQTTIDLVEQSGCDENSQVEYGAHAMKGASEALIWDPGEPMWGDGNGTRRWSITPFVKNSDNIAGDPVDVEFVWHVQPLSSIPSEADKANVFNCTVNGSMSNATWFVVGVKDEKVTFVAPSGRCYTIDMSDFRKMGLQQ